MPQTNVIIEIRSVLLFTLNLPRILHITSWKSANKIMVMGNLKNLRVFNFATLLKSRKFYAREIYMFYSITFTNFNFSPFSLDALHVQVCTPCRKSTTAKSNTV